MARLSVSVFLLLLGCTVCSKKHSKEDVNQQHSQPGKELNVSSNADSVLAENEATNLKDDPDSVVSKPVSETTYRFIVSFYSIGEGTEQKQIEKLEGFLYQYRQKNKKTIPVQKTFWGREGELDFCISLKEISLSDQLVFIQDCKNELKTAKWVHFIENSPCRKKRR